MKRKDILTLLIPSLIIVILWVVFSIYHNFISSTIPQSVNEQILGINPDFDSKTIDSIKNRTVVTPLFTASPLISPAQLEPSPTPTVAANPDTSSADAASQGGALNP